MFRYLAVSSAAVVGLLAVATAPAEAGRRTGTWKYWNPYMAQTAPQHWQKPHYAPHAGRGRPTDVPTATAVTSLVGKAKPTRALDNGLIGSPLHGAQ